MRVIPGKERQKQGSAEASPSPRSPQRGAARLNISSDSDAEDHEIELIKKFSNLKILQGSIPKDASSTDSENESDDDLEDYEVIEKGPDRTRICKEGTSTKPYDISVHSSRNLQCGGLTIESDTYKKTDFTQTSVTESALHEGVSYAYNHMNDSQRSTLFEAIDKICNSTCEQQTVEKDDLDSLYVNPKSNDSAYYSTDAWSPVTCQRLPSESGESPLHESPTYNLLFNDIHILSNTKPYCLSENKSLDSLIIDQNYRGSWDVWPEIRAEGISVSENGMDKSAYERIKGKLNDIILSSQWHIVCLESDEEFTEIDNYGNTKLMALLKKPINTKGYIEQVWARVEKMKKENLKLFLHKNSNNENALQIAAFKCYENPTIVRYIAEAMHCMNQNLNELTDDHNNTLIHDLARQGDNYALVLAELLNAKDNMGACLFEIDSRNSLHETPLHVAVTSHSRENATVSIIKLLVKHSADVNAQNHSFKTPLHLAVIGSCNPYIIRTLLQNPIARFSLNILDEKKNSPLHYAATRNDIPLKTQKEVITQLVESGARIIQNCESLIPYALVSPERKQDLKNFFTLKTHKCKT